MNKILLFVLLLVIGRTYAQPSGALSIDNRQNPCGVYVTMSAKDEPTPYFEYACDITANTVYVGPFSAANWTSVWAFESAMGWSSIPYGYVDPSSTTFEWTDVTFQFYCDPLPLGCTSGGGVMSQGSTVNCYSGSTSWSYSCRNAQWTPAASGGGLTNVTVRFW